ncbi:MAG: tail fiber domain-containing protein [Chitinophagales bacterium]|nr:tail fiber domain-containing protein [Chitinophagales bacterium]
MTLNKILFIGLLLLAINTPSAFAQYYQTGATPTASYDNGSGNVGIGTTSPSSNLTVVGTFENIRNGITIGNVSSMLSAGLDGAGIYHEDGSNNAAFHLVVDNGNGTFTTYVGNANISTGSPIGAVHISDIDQNVLFYGDVTGAGDSRDVTLNDDEIGIVFRNPIDDNVTNMFMTEDHLQLLRHVDDDLKNITMNDNSIFVGAEDQSTGQLHFTNVASDPNVGVHISAQNSTEDVSLSVRTPYGVSITGKDQSNSTIGFSVADNTYSHLFSITNAGFVTVNGSGAVSGTWAVSSDERYKKNIVAVNGALEKINKLNGVYYNYKTEEFPKKNFESVRQLGFIAQQVEQVVPEVVRTYADGYKGVAYQNLTALLVEGVKEQQGMINDNYEELKAELQKKDEQIAELMSRLTKLEQGSGNIQNVEMGSSEYPQPSYIGQNVPNPFTEQTSIEYFVAGGEKGTMQITTEKGEIVKTLTLSPGHGKLEFNFNDFPSGQLIYSLYVGNHLIDSKKMVKAKF